MRLLPALAATVGLLLAAPAAEARVPHDFLGSFADGPMLARTGTLDSEFEAMVRSGSGSVRLVFDWRNAQPYERVEDVPPERLPAMRIERGVPTDWREIDGWVWNAAARRLALLPVVMIAPPWAARHPGHDASPPRDNADYARFLASLAERYGPGGAFWLEHTELQPMPIRDWQAWNEPHFKEFWEDQPYESDYVEMLRAARRELRAIDPGARLVLGGLSNRSWSHLARLYREGLRGNVDIVALHPFTAKVDGVIEIIRRTRRAMRRAGDARRPIMVTELSWTSAFERTEWTFGNETTERGQAAKIRLVLPRLARLRRKLRIEAVYWYTWLSEDRDTTYPFDYAGLSRLEPGGVVRKPAYRAFRATALSLVGCREKRDFADRCAS